MYYAKRRRLQVAKIKKVIEESPGERLRQTLWRRARLSRVDRGSGSRQCDVGRVCRRLTRNDRVVLRFGD